MVQKYPIILLGLKVTHNSCINILTFNSEIDLGLLTPSRQNDFFPLGGLRSIACLQASFKDIGQCKTLKDEPSQR